MIIIKEGIKMRLIDVNKIRRSGNKGAFIF